MMVAWREQRGTVGGGGGGGRGWVAPSKEALTWSRRELMRV